LINIKQRKRKRERKEKEREFLAFGADIAYPLTFGKYSTSMPA
jgi:hypothetical protein